MTQEESFKLRSCVWLLHRHLRPPRGESHAHRPDPHCAGRWRRGRSASAWGRAAGQLRPPPLCNQRDEVRRSNLPLPLPRLCPFGSVRFTGFPVDLSACVSLLQDQMPPSEWHRLLLCDDTACARSPFVSASAAACSGRSHGQFVRALRGNTALRALVFEKGGEMENAHAGAKRRASWALSFSLT